MRTRSDIMAAAFEDELKKIAQSKGRLAKTLIPAVAGAAGFEALRRANHDRRTGRAIRLQQGY